MAKAHLGDVALQRMRHAAGTVAAGGEPPIPSPRKYLPPGRVSKVQLSVFFEKPVRKQLRALGLEHDKTLQDLLREAINDLFAKYGRPEIAE
jgi:hypothetical protein